MTPYYERDGVTLYLGDCREALRALPESSVQCCVTSPPYWGLRDYGAEGQIGLERTPAEFVAAMVEVFREVWRVLRDDGTLWLNLGDCYATVAGKVGECPGGGEQGARWRGDVDRVRDDKRGYRGERLANGRGDQPSVLRSKTVGVGPMTQPNRMPVPGLKPKDLVGIPWRVAFALQADGWWLRSDIIWAKPNPMPESVQDRPTKAHEYLFLLSKSERYLYDAEAVRERRTSDEDANGFRGGAYVGGATFDNGQGGKRARSGNVRRVYGDDRGRPGSHIGNGVPWQDCDGKRNRRSVWTVATQPFNEAHFATFPPKLIEPCVLAGSRAGDVVLDPFNGAGTTGLVAASRGRRYVGCDVNAGYLDMSVRRIERATAQRALPLMGVAR